MVKKNAGPDSPTLKKSALVLLILTGVVSLFADWNHEAARSVAGQYLRLLGTSAFTLGLAAGLGEFIGYAFRLVSGPLIDRSRRYWAFILGGYLVQLSALPALAFVSGWELAVVLLLVERLGKAIRKPAHDALISFAAKQTGSGFAFGLHEALDQVGAFVGPVLFSILLFVREGSGELEAYREGLLWLFVPAGMAVALALAARWRFPRPERFEIPSKAPQVAFGGFSLPFWLITGAAAWLALGITDFPLIGLHLSRTEVLPAAAIPLLYAGAMAVDAAAALVAGTLYDRFGLKVLGLLFAAEVLTAPLIFLAPLPGLLAGMALWGISVGTQESILKAAVGDRVPQERRARAFGLFHTIYGSAWLLGSLALGAFYDAWGPLPLAVFSVAAQGVGAALFWLAVRQEARARDS